MENKNIDINGIIYTIYENGDVYHGNKKFNKDRVVLMAMHVLQLEERIIELQ